MADRFQMDRRVRKFRRFIWDISDDIGEGVAVFIGLVLAVAVCCLVWVSIIQVESWLR